NKDRLAKLFGEIRFVWGSKIAAPFETALKLALLKPLLQHLYAVIVMKSRKRRLDLFKLADVALERFELRPSFTKDTVDDVKDQSFAEVHHILVCRIGDLRLDHPEFGQVTASL